MDLSLLCRAIRLLFAGAALMAVLLFLPAGTVCWWNAWLLFLLLFLPMFAAAFLLFFKAPSLLEKRLRTKEKEKTQRRVVVSSSFMFLAAFSIAGFDFRFGWSQVPLWIVSLSSVLFLIGYFLYALVLRKNAYLSRTVEVQQGQTVVDDGPYALVRHPMYLATLLLFLTMPLILGSLPSFVIFLLYPFLIVKRIRNEEEVLLTQLEGYSAYMKKVRWRLIPFLW